MDAAEEEIKALVNAETAAWNARDARALAGLFHPDTVWPWPPNSAAHDPIHWVMPLGRYDRERWIRTWQELAVSLPDGPTRVLI
jgi:ketosteroid isomerase-like protein